MRIISRNGVDHLIYQLSPGGTAELVDIAVYSERGKGVGTEMLNEAIAELNKLGVNRFYAFTRQNNRLAQSFYAKNGFVGTVIPNFYHDGNGIVYVKEI